MSNETDFNLNPDSDVAAYVQIQNQIRFAIASGRLKPNDDLPSVRNLADHVGINPNTISKAYRDLEVLGLIRSQKGVGVKVTEDAPQLCHEDIWSVVKNHLRDAVAECLACGMPAEDIHDLVREAISERPKPYDTNEEPAGL